MTMIEKTEQEVAVSASAEARFFVPVRQNAVWTRTGFVALVALVLIVHVLVFGWLLYRDRQAAAMTAAEEPVPVEIVEEAPKPPPKPQDQPAPQTKPPPPDEATEKPATSAPRAPSKQPVDAKASDVKTEAPKAALPLRDGRPQPAKEAATPAPEPTAPAAKAAAAARLEDDKREAEALDKAKPDLDEKPDAAAQPKLTPNPSDTTTDAARQLAGLSDTPNYSFAQPTAMSSFPEGTEDNRYLAIVYAMVMSKNRFKGSAAALRGESGTVSIGFTVDPIGRLSYAGVMQTSGQADLDAFALAAVRAAAPFPPPPGSGAQQLTATMSFGDATGRH